MKILIMPTTGIALFTGPAFAAGSHTDSHDKMMKIGKPGKASQVSRSIEVTMKETDDGQMIFEPDILKIRKGETIRFVIKNAGELEHEIVFDDHQEAMKHKALMEKSQEMEHDDPNAVRLEAGAQGEILWTFLNESEFEFACLIPGHYEAGMKGQLNVVRKL